MLIESIQAFRKKNGKGFLSVKKINLELPPMHLTPPSVADLGCLVSRVEESHLHSCKQLTDKFEMHCARLEADHFRVQCASRAGTVRWCLWVNSLCASGPPQYHLCLQRSFCVLMILQHLAALRSVLLCLSLGLSLKGTYGILTWTWPHPREMGFNEITLRVWSLSFRKKLD